MGGEKCRRDAADMLVNFAPAASKTPQAAEATWGESYARLRLTRPEALTVFARADESFYHFGLDVIAAEVPQLRKPEVESGGIRIAPQITEIFHGHEGCVELAVLQ